MQPMEVAGACLLSPQKAQELYEGINETVGHKMLGVWCAETRFCVRVYVVDAVVQQWWITGPVGIEEARAELMGNVVHEPSEMAH